MRKYPHTDVSGQVDLIGLEKLVVEASDAAKSRAGMVGAREAALVLTKLEEALFWAEHCHDLILDEAGYSGVGA